MSLLSQMPTAGQVKEYLTKFDRMSAELQTTNFLLQRLVDLAEAQLPRDKVPAKRVKSET
jgi:hypothetical protein